GRNEETFRRKRNRLLYDLYRQGTFDSLTYMLATKESLPGTPKPLPTLAPHLLTRVIHNGKQGQRVRTTIDPRLQVRSSRILQRYHEQYRRANIFNGAILVLDVKTGGTLAYIGNTPVKGSEYGGQVDIITSRRSTGSLLKPFLFASMLDEGLILPATLVPDIPTVIRGFAPQNFDKDYSGAVAANEAVARSLNIPAVRMLQAYGTDKLHRRLDEAGMTTLDNGPDHYGLSLILGGAECTLWDISGMYAGMARSLNAYFELPEPSRYRTGNYHAPHYVHRSDQTTNITNVSESGLFTAGALWLTFEALKEVNRPETETGWEYYTGAKPMAYKTGTSYGHRDAWAIGVTSDYVVGVWIGNADGEGRPGLTGVTTAAPLLFEAASLMPEPDNFHLPESDLFEAAVCRQSGHRSTEFCVETDTVLITKKGLNTRPCPYHRQVFVTADHQLRVYEECYQEEDVVQEKWFVLPASQEWYYKRHHTDYRSLPPVAESCLSLASGKSMELIYPKSNARLIIPVELNGQSGGTIFEVAHRLPKSTIYWHLDGKYTGKTKEIHQMTLSPSEGRHNLLLTDEKGDRLEVAIEVH
ncbi:MAG: penicillin-binding transpeptidase domain-containing protein, partial [Cyclobacteriaceae bacterium]